MDMNEFVFGLRVTVIGMGIVFASLYGLQLVMYGMKAVFYKEPVAQQSMPAQAESENEPAPVEDGIPAGVVAAISVAVACFMGGRPGNVVSIRKSADTNTPWKHAARGAAMINRRSN